MIDISNTMVLPDSKLFFVSYTKQFFTSKVEVASCDSISMVDNRPCDLATLCSLIKEGRMFNPVYHKRKGKESKEEKRIKQKYGFYFKYTNIIPISFVSAPLTMFEALSILPDFIKPSIAYENFGNREDRNVFTFLYIFKDEIKLKQLKEITKQLSDELTNVNLITEKKKFPDYFSYDSPGSFLGTISYKNVVNTNIIYYINDDFWSNKKEVYEIDDDITLWSYKQLIDAARRSDFKKFVNDMSKHFELIEHSYIDFKGKENIPTPKDYYDIKWLYKTTGHFKKGTFIKQGGSAKQKYTFLKQIVIAKKLIKPDVSEAELTFNLLYDFLTKIDNMSDPFERLYLYDLYKLMDFVMNIDPNMTSKYGSVAYVMDKSRPKRLRNPELNSKSNKGIKYSKSIWHEQIDYSLQPKDDYNRLRKLFPDIKFSYKTYTNVRYSKDK
jgi:hypothetical protein